MCGIAGWYRRVEAVPETIVTRQCDTLFKRGPDDDGVFVDGDFGFGMRRLSIIDVAGGHQPIFSADGRFVIVFNGEIYNHLELRRELESLGHSFRTRSDTETILVAFIEWGDEAWRRLLGMFAVAIWDRSSRELTLARDPLGIKPLYISEQNGGLAFASDLRALRVLPDHQWDIDPRSAHDYFSFGYVQPPRCIYAQAHSLGPGQLLHATRTDCRVATYWRPKFRANHDLTEQEWIEEMRSRVQASVKAHMLSDVPVGAFLSGGADSTAITAAMTKAATAPVKAFTLGFPGTSIDETEAAARIANKLGVEHHVLPLEPLHAGEVLPQVQADFDEPCAATAALPLWHLSRFARQQVKVVLCGEGADEILTGYKRQRTARLASRLAPFLRAPSPLGRMIDVLPSGGSTSRNYLLQNVKRFRSAARLDNNLQRYIAATQISTPAVRAVLFEPGFWQEEDERTSFARQEREFFRPDDRKLAPLDQVMLGDLTIHMPASLLSRLDRASMAHSLEGRVPFLSRDFVDWSLTIPLNMKLRGRVGKYALREAIKPWLGDCAPSPQKRGFQLPFGEWFRGDFSRFAREAWFESGARDAGYLRPQSVERLFAEHDAGLANHGRILFAIAMFGCWWEQVIAQRGNAGHPRLAATQC